MDAVSSSVELLMRLGNRTRCAGLMHEVVTETSQEVVNEGLNGTIVVRALPRYIDINVLYISACAFQ